MTRSLLTIVVLLLATFAPPATGQTLLGGGEVAVVTDQGFYAMSASTNVTARRLAPVGAFGELVQPAVEWRRGTDDFLVVSGDRLFAVTLTSLSIIDSAIVTDITPAFPAPSAVELRDLDVDPGLGHVWLLDRLNARAFRLDEPLTAGAAPSLTVSIPASSRSLCVDSRRYPLSLICGTPEEVRRVDLDGTVSTVVSSAGVDGLDVDPTLKAYPVICDFESDKVARAVADPNFTSNMNVSEFCAPIVYGPQDVEWDPSTNRGYVLAQGGVSPCQFPIDPTTNSNHVVRLSIAIGLGFGGPVLVTNIDGSGIQGADGDLAIARDEFAFSEPYGPTCTLASGDEPFFEERAAGGPPILGNDEFELLLTNGPSTAPALLLLGFAPTSVPLQGCTLLVQSPFLFDLGTTNANGSLLIPFPVPNAPFLVGIALYWQMRMIDDDGKGRLSNGVLTHFGY